MKFKIGDMVQIKSSSVFFENQGHYGVGKIVNNEGGLRYKYQVKFKTREDQLGYTAKDIEHASINYKMGQS